MLKKFGHIAFLCFLCMGCLSPLPSEVEQYTVSTADSLEPQQVRNAQGYMEWRLNERGPKLEITFPFDEDIVMSGLRGVTEIGGQPLPLDMYVTIDWCSPNQSYVCSEEADEDGAGVNGNYAGCEWVQDCHPEQILNPDLISILLAENIRVTATVRQPGRAAFNAQADCYDISANIFHTIKCSFYDRRIVDSGTVTLHKEFSYIKNGVQGTHEESSPEIPYELSNRPIPSNAAQYYLSYHPLQPDYLTLKFRLTSYANRNLMERSVRNTIINAFGSGGGGGQLRNRCELQHTEEDIYVECSFRRMRDLDELQVSFPGYFGGAYTSPQIRFSQAFASPNLATINPLPQNTDAYRISYSEDDAILSFSLDRNNTDMTAGHFENSVRHIQIAEDGPDGVSQSYAECRITVRWDRRVECSFSTQSRRAQTIMINYSQYGFGYESPAIAIPARPATQAQVPPRNNRRDRQAEDQDDDDGRVRAREEESDEEVQAQTTHRSPRKPFGGISNTSYQQDENTDGENDTGTDEGSEEEIVDARSRFGFGLSESSSCSLAVQNKTNQSHLQQIFTLLILQILVYTRKKLALKK